MILSPMTVHVTDEDESDKLINKEDVGWDYEHEYGTPDTVGWSYEFEVKSVRKDPIEYAELLKCLDNESFRLKEEYDQMREYLEKLRDKQTPSGDSLFDLFN